MGGKRRTRNGYQDEEEERVRSTKHINLADCCRGAEKF